MRRTTRSNCWCSRTALLPVTWCWSSCVSARRAALLLRARNTAGIAFRASEILLSKTWLMQLQSTSRRRAELLTTESWLATWAIDGPGGTMRGS
uniref:Putative secreted protein n=1 Tax=Ixodes ricinus TaxID=34613 RepID=A0A6B0U8V1_IXORI